jgi:hypothetical protein
MFNDSALQIGVQHMKNLRFKRFAQLPMLGASLLAAGFLAFSAHAAQTVTPRSAATGGTDFTGTTQSVPSNGSFTFYGTYSDDTGTPESGLGLKLKYDGTKINVAISEEYTKCRIATAQQQNAAASNAQWVFGWIDTSIRASGAVGWPDLADTTAGGATSACLNPGTINTETAAASAAGLKLFKGVVTWVGTPAVGTTALISLDDEGNFSYANAGAAFTDKSFTVQAAAASTLALAAANPYVSRKTHGAAGAFDLPINPAGAATGTTITVEPRQAQTGSHQIVVNFTGTVSASEFPAANISATVSAGGSGTRPATASFNGNSMIVTVGNAGSPIPNGARITVNMTGAGAAAGVSPSVVVGFLVGDVSGNRTVNSTDVGTVKGQSGVAVTSANYLSDLSANGTINSTDVGVVKGASGSTLN